MMSGHGSKPLRGLESTGQSQVKTGKFGRMFRWLSPCFQPANSRDEMDVESLLGHLATLMVSSEFNDRIDNDKKKTPDGDIDTPEPDDENRLVPAGYTYLGQFIDHDITFDPASSLQKQNDPDALEDFRTPRLDLDSLYGRGPDDQPYLYAAEKAGRFRFRLGHNRGHAGQERPDLLRSDDGTALIGDKRNDENKIVRQIHALFLRFHNRVFDDLGPRYAGSRRSAGAVSGGAANRALVLPVDRRARFLAAHLPRRRRPPRASGTGCAHPQFSVLSASLGRSVHARRVLGRGLSIWPLDGASQLQSQRFCEQLREVPIKGRHGRPFCAHSNLRGDLGEPKRRDERP